MSSKCIKLLKPCSESIYKEDTVNEESNIEDEQEDEIFVRAYKSTS